MGLVHVNILQQAYLCPKLTKTVVKRLKKKVNIYEVLHVDSLKQFFLSVIRQQCLHAMVRDLILTLITSKFDQGV